MPKVEKTVSQQYPEINQEEMLQIQDKIHSEHMVMWTEWGEMVLRLIGVVVVAVVKQVAAKEIMISLGFRPSRKKTRKIKKRRRLQNILTVNLELDQIQN